MLPSEKPANRRPGTISKFTRSPSTSARPRASASRSRRTLLHGATPSAILGERPKPTRQGGDMWDTQKGERNPATAHASSASAERTVIAPRWVAAGEPLSRESERNFDGICGALRRRGRAQDELGRYILQGSARRAGALRTSGRIAAHPIGYPGGGWGKDLRQQAIRGFPERALAGIGGLKLAEQALGFGKELAALFDPLPDLGGRGDSRRRFAVRRRRRHNLELALDILDAAGELVQKLLAPDNRVVREREFFAEVIGERLAEKGVGPDGAERPVFHFARDVPDERIGRASGDEKNENFSHANRVCDNNFLGAEIAARPMIIIDPPRASPWPSDRDYNTKSPGIGGFRVRMGAHLHPAPHRTARHGACERSGRRLLPRSPERPSADNNMEERVRRVLEVRAEKTLVAEQTVDPDEESDNPKSHDERTLEVCREGIGGDERDDPKNEMRPVLGVIEPPPLAEQTILSRGPDDPDEPEDADEYEHHPADLQKLFGNHRLDRTVKNDLSSFQNSAQSLRSGTELCTAPSEVTRSKDPRESVFLRPKHAGRPRSRSAYAEPCSAISPATLPAILRDGRSVSSPSSHEAGQTRPGCSRTNRSALSFRRSSPAERPIASATMSTARSMPSGSMMKAARWAT